MPSSLAVDGIESIASQHDRPPQEPSAYYRRMGRKIGAILGAILAVWGIFSAIGWFSAMLKTFVIVALIAAVVFIVVWLLAGRRRQD